MIEVSPDSKKSTVFELSDLHHYNRLDNLENVISHETWFRFQPYFENIPSVEVLIFKGKSMLGIDSLIGGLFLGRLIRSRKYDVVHFDTASGRAISSLLFLKQKQMVMTIHDPVPHVGQESFLLEMVRVFYKRQATSLIFYSAYSTRIFKQYNKYAIENINQLRLQPYSFISQFKQTSSPTSGSILFFGQLSFYKGIDLLFEAIPEVLQVHPNEHFVIAGKSSGYNIDKNLLDQYKQHLTFIDEYLSIEKLSHMINASKFVVCPYREATQSGVLMTAFAMGKTVLATNIGAFPEYILDGINGKLTNPDAQSIARGIISMLDTDLYLELEKNIVSGYSTVDALQNTDTLMKVYDPIHNAN
jgi:glycosyltransferase involved in cell wall biosynthesis